MFTLSAFADEISPDPVEQVRVLKACGISHIEFRSIDSTNVLALSDARIREFKALLDDNGMALSAIGSPIGKIRIDEPFAPHLDKFHRAIELAHLFGTPNIRVFSYYPADGSDWTLWRNVVMDRMRTKADIAQRNGIVLFHENEHRIFGDSPERLADLFSQVVSPSLKAAYDAANFVYCGYDPIVGWEASKPHLGHLHIKDWKHGETHGSIAGTGEGRIPESIADAVKIGYDGFATLEPHLLGGGPTGGVTGPELFPEAVRAFRDILAAAGGRSQ